MKYNFSVTESKNYIIDTDDPKTKNILLEIGYDFTDYGIFKLLQKIYSYPRMNDIICNQSNSIKYEIESEDNHFCARVTEEK